MSAVTVATTTARRLYKGGGGGGGLRSGLLRTDLSGVDMKGDEMKILMGLWWFIRNVAAEMTNPWLVGLSVLVAVTLKLMGLL